MAKYYFIIIFCFSAMGKYLQAQTKRIRDYNHIGWMSTTGTININQHTSLHTEYQFRRSDWGKTWQQSMVRIGFNHHFNKHASYRIGYAWIETYPYGNYPINPLGKQFTEHRIYQALITTQTIGRFDLTNRYMLEQRLLGAFNTPQSAKPDVWTYINRIRYMGKLQTSLLGKTLDDNEPYLGLSNEVLIGFGVNIGENIFDQNRLGLFLGWKFNDHVKLELGYLHQVLQLGREINNKNVYQYNSGYMINTFWNL